MAAGVSILSDLSYSMTGGCGGGTSTEMETANARVPTAKYTKMGETLRHVIPSHMQCSMACGGKACKYENPSRWSSEEQAISGLYSSWITDNLLAMARPSTEIIEKYNIIEQFKRCELKTVINLQRPGEHASCGNPLEQESGFTYRPEMFMEAGINYGRYLLRTLGLQRTSSMEEYCQLFVDFYGRFFYGHSGCRHPHYMDVSGQRPPPQISGCIVDVPKVIHSVVQHEVYYYNFGWKDYGVASLTTILDMVKVMSFAVQEGKLAVHCHAGLGRTGVLVACYLVFTSRMSADQAILFVRAKRPNSIQTRGQLLCVREFAQFLVPLRSIFSCAEPKASAVTLSQYLIRQRHLLHGYEARQMKNVPKIVQLVCRLLIDIAANRPVRIEEEWLEVPDLTAEVEKTVSLQALKQLGKELRGKGIPVAACSSQPFSPTMLQSKLPHDQPLASDNELDPLWRKQNAESPLTSFLSNNRSLSCSDSVLYELGFQQNEGNLKNNKSLKYGLRHSLSHSSLPDCNTPMFCDVSPQDIISSIHEPSTEAKPELGFTSVKKQLHRGHHSLSLDLSVQGRKFHQNATALPVLLTKSKVGTSDEQPDVGEKGHFTKDPCVSLQPEMSVNSRRLLVARALAMDLSDKELHSKVSQWQMELNAREGAWERLCMVRDPLVLSSLMWSWLEQLKDPIISMEDIKSLSENINPQKALDSLEKGHRLTLLCILDCAAHLLPLPEDVEATFLCQTIKMFTQIDPASEENKSLHMTLKAILTHILHELCDKAVEGNEDS